MGCSSVRIRPLSLFTFPSRFRAPDPGSAVSETHVVMTLKPSKCPSWPRSSVVEHPTADWRVPGSIPGAASLCEIARLSTGFTALAAHGSVAATAATVTSDSVRQRSKRLDSGSSVRRFESGHCHFLRNWRCSLQVAIPGVQPAVYDPSPSRGRSTIGGAPDF